MLEKDETRSNPIREEIEQKAIRSGYEYAQTLGNLLAAEYPEGDIIDVSKEIQWATKQISDDAEGGAELLPYVNYGFRQGTIDLLYSGEHRYAIEEEG